MSKWFAAVFMLNFITICSIAQVGDGICPDVITDFQVNDVDFDFFIVGIDDGIEVIWNFGDETELIDDDSISHTFVAGSYIVSATFMDADCPWDGPTILTVTVVVSECWLELNYVQGKNGLYTFTATGYPEKYPMYWTMGDGSEIVETWVVDNIYEPGSYEVCCWIITPFCADTVKACVEFTYTIDIDVESSSSPGFSVFPNPGFEQFTISGLRNSGSVITLFDISGRKIIVQPTYGNSTQIDLSEVNDGIYFLKFSNGCNTEQQAVMVMKK